MNGFSYKESEAWKHPEGGAQFPVCAQIWSWDQVELCSLLSVFHYCRQTKAGHSFIHSFTYLTNTL